MDYLLLINAHPKIEHLKSAVSNRGGAPFLLHKWGPSRHIPPLFAENTGVIWRQKVPKTAKTMVVNRPFILVLASGRVVSRRVVSLFSKKWRSKNPKRHSNPTKRINHKLISCAGKKTAAWPLMLWTGGGLELTAAFFWKAYLNRPLVADPIIYIMSYKPKLRLRRGIVQ